MIPMNKMIVFVLLAHVIASVRSYLYRTAWTGRSRDIQSYHGYNRRHTSLFGLAEQFSVDEFRKQLIETVKSMENQKLALPEDHSKPSTEDESVTLSLKQLYKKWVELQKQEKLPWSDSKVIPLNDIVPFLFEDKEINEANRRGKTYLLVDEGSSSSTRPLLPGYDIEDDTEEDIYITESELLRLWSDVSQKTFGRPIAQYSTKDALLLIDDKTDEYVMFETNSNDEEQLFSKSEVKAMQVKASKKGNNEPIDLAVTDSSSGPSTTSKSGLLTIDQVIASAASQEEPELFISSQELEQSWINRPSFGWGEPGLVYNEKNALLLLCDDYESDFELGSYVGQYPFEQSTLSSVSQPNTGMMVWDNIADADMRDTVRRTIEDIEDPSTYRPAWKKGTNFLTPDIDTQKFEGDIMFGNTYLTTRVPANWNDFEAEEMSDTYRETGTMAWPDQPETNFNIQVPLWEQMNLTVGRKHLGYSMSDLNPLRVPIHMYEERIEREIQANLKAEQEEFALQAGLDIPQMSMKPTISTDGAAIDWSNFNFQSLEDQANEMVTQEEIDMANPRETNEEIGEDVDIQTFFKNLSNDLDPSVSSIKPSDEDIDDEFQLGEIELFPGNSVPSQADASICRNFTTPKEWLEKWENDPDGMEYVTYDEWSTYAEEFAACDDLEWMEDRFVKLSVNQIQNITSYYLRDLTDINDRNDRRRYIYKVLDMKLTEYYRENVKDTKYRELFGFDSAEEVDSSTGRILDMAVAGGVVLDPMLKDPIPPYLIPNMKKGVNYTSAIMELKGKKILEPEPDNAAEIYKNDKFTNNEDLITLNKVGTIREQYNWLPMPVPSGGYEIDPNIVEKIQPAIRFVNHAAKLKSTKDNIILFEYLGAMKHIIGIREMTKNMALKHFPELKDLRMETERLSDKADG